MADTIALSLDDRLSYTLAEEEFHAMVVEMLNESLARAARPDAKWLTIEEIFGPLGEKYGFDL